MSSKATKAMSADNEQIRGIVPKLRFPTFQDAAGWTARQIVTVLDLEYGSPPAQIDRNGGAIPVIGSNGIVGFHNHALVHGPVVVGRKGSAGKVNVPKKNHIS